MHIHICFLPKFPFSVILSYTYK